MMTSEINIAVVIPTKDRPLDLARAVRSVLGQSLAPNELIVIDQSLKPLRSEIERQIGCQPQISLKYVYDPMLTGLTAAKNAAIKISESDILVFIDDDIVLDPHFIATICGIYEKYPEVDGVGGVALIPKQRTSFLRRQLSVLFQVGPFRDPRSLLQAGYFWGKEIVPTWLLSGGLSSLRKKVFESVLFNENLLGASPVEDMDFYFRCRDRFHFVIAVNAKALHNVSALNRGSLRKVYEGRSRGFFYLYKTHIKKNFFNRCAFLWRICGLLIDVIITSVAQRSFGPVLGLICVFRDPFNSQKQNVL